MPQVSIDQSWSHYIKINFAGHKHDTESSNPFLKFRPFSDYVLVSKVCWIRFSSWESFIGFHIWGCPILTSLACLFTVCAWISWKKLCWKESDGGWVFILCLPPHVLYCIDGEFEKILTKLRLRIKDNNNHLYRVSFVDFYFALPTNFRVVFLPHTNTVILLEKYCCGTWLSSFYIKSFYIITVPGWPVVHLKIL